MIVILQGHKVGYLADQVFRYDPNHYLLMTLPLPCECECFASPSSRLSGLPSRSIWSPCKSCCWSWAMPCPPAPQKSGVHSVPLSETMFCAAERLIELMDNPLHARVLGPQTVREMLFHALTEGAARRCRRSPIATTMWARSPGCCV